MNYPLFIAACLMVYWPTLVLWAICYHITNDDKKLLIKLSGIIWLGLIAVALTIISLGLVLAFKSFVPKRAEENTQKHMTLTITNASGEPKSIVLPAGWEADIKPK